VTDYVEQPEDCTLTLVHEDGIALMKQGAQSGDFVAPVSGWYRLVDGQWTLTERRPVPDPPRLQGFAALLDPSSPQAAVRSWREAQDGGT
jgi:hypothetical protein